MGEREREREQLKYNELLSVPNKYFLSVRDTKQQQLLPKYRLSDSNLADETGRPRAAWLPKSCQFEEETAFTSTFRPSPTPGKVTSQ